MRFLELIWPAVSHRISVFLELIWPAVSHRISVFGVDLACCFSSYPTRVILMSKSKSILDFFKVNLESEKVTNDSPEDHDHSEPSVSGLVPPVTGGVASESLVVDDTDLLHEGLDINQHASDECTIPSELPKTLECLPMEEDPSQDALHGPSQDALQVPTQDALEVPTQDALQDAIRQSRKLNDNEKYELLISEQKGLADADLNTIWFSVAEGRKRKRIQFQRRWRKIINGFDMVHLKNFREVGACHAFCS